MQTAHTVILYGGSLFVAAVAAALREQPEIDLVCVAEAAEDDGERLAALDPVAFVCEPGTTDRDGASPVSQLLSRIPDILVIELNLQHSTVTLITREQRAVTRATDVVEAIVAERQSRQQRAAILTKIRSLLKQAAEGENGGRVMNP